MLLNTETPTPVLAATQNNKGGEDNATPDLHILIHHHPLPPPSLSVFRCRCAWSTHADPRCLLHSLHLPVVLLLIFFKKISAQNDDLPKITLLPSLFMSHFIIHSFILSSMYSFFLKNKWK